GPKNEFCTNDENGYDSKTTPQSQHISLKKVGEDTMNFIELNNISGIKKWDGKDALSNYYSTNVLKDTINISEPCSFYTLLHECIHVLYYEKPLLEELKTGQSQSENCAGCFANANFGVTNMNPNQTDYVMKAKLAEYNKFKREVANLYFKKLNHDMAIKVENYFRVNLRKLDNSSGKIFVRTSIGHLGTIDDQESIDKHYKKDCFKDWWDKKKGTYPSYFMDIDSTLYELPSDILNHLAKVSKNSKESIYGQAILGKANITDDTKNPPYWKEKYNGTIEKYKDIYNLE
ncbi:MAG: hypothetical protein J5965_07855, partial [Aeriscardovia sp.]|nr:hypothetical protein [Aeriscardovia sp.]